MCYAYERTETKLKKVNYSIGILEEVLERQEEPYVAGSKALMSRVITAVVFLQLKEIKDAFIYHTPS
jgi:hypothetical protein